MSNNVEIYKGFVASQKSLLIAPAGYGKTHTIAECLNYSSGHQLILTHTHAGVASIKEKIKRINPTCKYTVETISSFAQKYVESYYCKDDKPEQDSKDYFTFIISKAILLFSLNIIEDVVKTTYSGLFVDEYQDCTLAQHQLILSLANYLPLHILGDPLQGIFDFNGETLVNITSDLTDFKIFELEEPWRWKKTNPKLGENFKIIRESLINNLSINLNDHTAITKHIIREGDLNNPQSNYFMTFNRLLNSNDTSFLIIHPDSENKNIRINLVKKFKNRIRLIEAIDSKEFYDFSRKIDNSSSVTIYNALYEISLAIFNKTGINNWFNKSGVISKRAEEDKKIIEPIQKNILLLKENKSLVLFKETLSLIIDLPGINCCRKEIFYDLIKALSSAYFTKNSVYESMKEIRNIKRRVGRKHFGKCIGTTLLTKGLEFDTVIIMDAHKFKDKKNLYVALTRATNNLTIFTENEILSIPQV